ncbi:MAG: hypothetical protein DRN30_01010 [Thermoplasmata archaeon]|nr:triphosphoribosyl-dephospho-CoA synthase [Euryarchaeota archaeon]RLF66984.1 MAG: hypothetical protein DRN30_01010 [Thermoplasmata archaeon]
MISEKAFLACMLELLAPKPGNVNRYHDFKNKTIIDFLYGSISVVRLVRDVFLGMPPGDALIESVQTMLRLARGNTHLGILIMFFPISMAAKEIFFWNRSDLAKRASEVLKEIPPEETVKIAKAVKYVSPPLPMIGDRDMDVTTDEVLRNILEKKITAYEWFKAGSSVNIVAKELVDGYKLTLEVSRIIENKKEDLGLSKAIVDASIYVMSRVIDSHMAAEKGESLAKSAMEWARAIVVSGYDDDEIKKFDSWLREHQANPGSTADIVTTALFLLLLEGVL